MSDILVGESLNLFNKLNDPNAKIVAHLCKNPIAEDVDKIALSDLVEADFVGYAPVLLNDWFFLNTGDLALGEAVSQQMEFVAGDLIDAQVVYGEYLTISLASGPHYLLKFNRFDNPIIVDVEGMIIHRQVRIVSADLPE